jgi:spore germination protein
MFFRSSFRNAVRRKSARLPQPSIGQQPETKTPISVRMNENTKKIKDVFGNSNDLVIREFAVGNTGTRCALIFIDGMVDKAEVEQAIVRNIQLGMPLAGKVPPDEPDRLITVLMEQVVSMAELNEVQTLEDAVLHILSGDSMFFLEKSSKCYAFGTKGWRDRGVEEPKTESVVRGSRDGFTETIRTNTALIRRRVADASLRFKMYQVGRRSKRNVFLTYMEGIANPALVDETARRLESIDIDYVPESGTIEQCIEDSFLSPFPQIMHTERPDKVAAALMEGRVAILIDGTPFVLVLPITLGSMLISSEDYYERWQIGTFIRFLRYGAAFIALFLPSFYIALVSFQPGMIPSLLAFSIAGSREGVPFPAFVEALMMELTLELLREAGIRLPKPIGQTIGIVGGLVIGEAAVSAGIVSPIMVIVVSVTAISSFTLPSYSFGIAIRLIRFTAMVASAIFGVYGIILVYIMINVHIANLTSFGIPYSTPFAPFFKSDWKDLFIRAPYNMLYKRPTTMQTGDVERQDRGMKEGEGE